MSSIVGSYVDEEEEDPMRDGRYKWEMVTGTENGSSRLGTPYWVALSVGSDYSHITPSHTSPSDKDFTQLVTPC